MKTLPIRILWACTVLVWAYVPPASAQVGYIAVHLKALNEESSPSFTFNITGGPSTVAPFTLSDLPGMVHCSDLGGSHSTTGGGELWVITGPQTNGQLVYRKPGTGSWVVMPDSAVAVDGAGPGQCVYTTVKGFVVAYDNGKRDTIYHPAQHGGHLATDVGNNASLAQGQGLTAIVDDRNDLLLYTGNYASHGETWTNVSEARGLPGGIQHVDVNASSNSIVFSTSAAIVYQLSATGTLTSLGTPGKSPANADVACDDAGGVYAIAQAGATGGDGVYAWQGGVVWKGDSSSREMEHITGGAAGALWGVNNFPSTGGCRSQVFSRATDATHFWYDNEWMTLGTGNTAFVPVAPGTYTLTETVPDSWACQAIKLNDPTGNSTSSVQTHTAVVNVSAGEVVTVGFQDGLVKPAAIPQVCNYAVQQDFGAGTAAIAAPLQGQTDYHYLASGFVQDGYYTLAKTTGTSWGAQNLVDHTNGKGYFMIVNASYGLDEFYRERVTGLVPGLKYTLSAYIANISPTAPLRPNVLFGISDAGTGALLGSLSTGDITNSTWQQYSFTFVATTATADIFLSNNGLGGVGNDLALDDIAFSPIPNTVSPIAHALPDTICQGSTLQLSDTASGGTWTVLDPVASVSPSGLVSALQAGNARVTFSTVNAIGCVSADTLAVTVWPRVQASDIHLSQTAACVGDSLVLRASTGLASPRFSWYADSALAHLLDTGSALSTGKLLATSDYYVSLTALNTCAGAPARQQVTVYPYPTVAAIAGGAQVCAGVPLTLTDPTPGGVWSGTSSLDSGVVRGSQAGVDTVSYTVYGGGICPTRVTHPVTVWANPVVGSILGARNLCERDTLTLSDSTAGGVWTGASAAGLFTGSTVGPVAVVYSVTNPHGCTTQVSASFQVEGAPPVPTIDAGSAPSVCGGKTQPLTATPGDLYAYRWYLDGNRYGTDSGSVLATTQPGNYTVVAATDAGCTSTGSAPVEVSSRCEVSQQADVALRKTVSAGPYSLQQPVTYTLTVVNNGPGMATSLSIVDSLSPNLGEPAGYSGFYNGINRALYWNVPSLAPEDSVVFTFSIPLAILDNVANTASVSSASPDPDPSNNRSTAMIYEDAGLFIPNAVSPNGDGKNDRFLIVGLDRYPGSSLTVFNRWGNEVYHTDNYANDWSGSALSDGTYFYILLLNTSHGKEAHKGWVEILHK